MTLALTMMTTLMNGAALGRSQDPPPSSATSQSAAAIDLDSAAASNVEPDGVPSTRARHSEPSLLPPAPGSVPADAWFPSQLRPLKQYLQMANRFGVKTTKPGAIFDESIVIEDAAQWIKTELADIGIRYSFDQAIIYAAMSDRAQGSANVGAYSYDFFGHWNILEADELGGTSGWLSMKFVGGTGIGDNWLKENPKKNVGAIAGPNNNFHSVDFAFEEVAWGQSFNDGELVVLAGMINQTNYLDINRYANSSHGQFLNDALVNSMVLPAPGNNLGINIQWQPNDSWYFMLGVGGNNQRLGQSPFSDVTWQSISYVGEIGWMTPDFCGLGPGTYRLQPFVAQWEDGDGDWGGGVAFNIDQQLGKNSPLGVFARVGFADDVAAAANGGVQAQGTIGLAMLAPFSDSGRFSEHNDDFIGLGFVWTQAADGFAAFHENEYALELTAAFQLTPTSTIQPDLQVIWDAANNPSDGPSVVFQLQLNIAW